MADEWAGDTTDSKPIPSSLDQTGHLVRRTVILIVGCVFSARQVSNYTTTESAFTLVAITHTKLLIIITGCITSTEKRAVVIINFTIPQFSPYNECIVIMHNSPSSEH